LTFDLFTLEVLSESRVTWATSVPIFVFLGLSVLELGPMYATDRQTYVRRQTKASLNASDLRDGGIITGKDDYKRDKIKTMNKNELTTL